MRDGLLKRGYMYLAGVLDRCRGWDRLPKPIAMLTLIGLRMWYRRHNLYDTTGVAVGWGPQKPPPGPRSLVRSADGTGTDPIHMSMGAAGTRFGRNVPIDQTSPQDVASPNPRLISNELLARKDFIPARTLNLLAAAWIQFQVHDWMSHGTNQPVDENSFRVDIEQEDDQWPPDERPMVIRRTTVDPTSDGNPPAYLNTETHWWDASQVYGSNEFVKNLLRTHAGDGHLKLTPQGVIPFDPPTMELPKGVAPDIAGITGNWWLGLAMMHTLFMLEHNAICDHLHGVYPHWTDDQLYDHGRLINAALMAKIHTVEWTPSLLADSVMETGMRVNFWGLQGQRLWERFGRLTPSEELSGIPGSGLYYHGAPYAMTEEFVAVYRMHPLIPDNYGIRHFADDKPIQKYGFTELAGTKTHLVLENPLISMADFFYSFGTSNPGAITLHNFPNALRQFLEPDGTLVDLAAIDIVRCRERGVPRYNDFRRLWNMAPARTFEDFSSDRQVVEELRRIYRDPDEVDLMIGLYAEDLPPGFAFSDTAFRVFILMASRRLKSDRFFTYDYRPEVYTKEGLQWIETTTMKDVVLRHYPVLADALSGVDNAFKPWNRAPFG